MEAIEKIEIEFCPRTDIPCVYGKFFGYDPAAEEELAEGEEVVEDAAPKPPVKKSGKKGGEPQPITITVKSRTKKKQTTTIAQLEGWGINPKDFSKGLAKKLAIGCSTRNKGGGTTEVVIQGDATAEIASMLSKDYKIPPSKISKVKKVKKPAATQ